MARLLITGGAGFIGSHTCLVLLDHGHDLVVLDNFANSSPEAISRVMSLGKVEGSRRLVLIQGDVRRSTDLDTAFEQGPFEAVIHFAGLKAVGESLAKPLAYWDVNVCGTHSLLAAMQRHHCRTLVFSSSATLYGYPNGVPIPETAPIVPINPYGQTKAAVEQMLHDTFGSEPGWRIASLRYFNPVGAHPSGQIGEDPNGIPNNLFPFVSQVAVGRREEVQVFGGDWPTPDGSGIRDYIHVMDLAEGHSAALNVLLSGQDQLLTLNLGSGVGHSVLEVIEAFELACKRRIPHRIVDRRPGDAAITIADPSQAQRILGWKTQRTLRDICRDGWAWQFSNPEGYGHSS